MLAAARASAPPVPPDPSANPLVTALGFAGLLDVRTGGWAQRLQAATGVSAVTRRRSLIVFVLEQEAVRQAVRCGHRQVGPAHLLLAVLELERQLVATGRGFGPQWLPANAAGRILHDHGVTYDLVAGAGDLPGEDEDADRSRPWRSARSDPTFCAAAGRAADAAREHARSQGNRLAGTGHVLCALLTDPAGPVPGMLERLGVRPPGLLAATRDSLEPSAGHPGRAG